MINRIIFALLVLPGIMSGQHTAFESQKNSRSGWETMQLNGKVSSLAQIQYTAVDSSGKAVRGVRAYPEFASINQDFTMNFDSAGRTIEEVIIYRNRSTELKHFYDDVKNTESIVTSWNNGKEWNKSVYRYDKDGRIIGTAWIQHLGEGKEFSNQTTVKLDDKGRAIESFSVSGGKTEFRTIFTYDKNDRLSAMEVFRENGPLWSKQRYYYNQKGHRVREEGFKADTTKVYQTVVSEYDQHGNAVKKVIERPGEKTKNTYSYIYSYDPAGNWVSRTDIENGKAVRIVDRKITYYPAK